MRKRGRFGSLLGATIAVVMAALIGVAGFGAALAQLQTLSCDPPTQIFSENGTNILPGESGKALIFVQTCVPGYVRVSEFGHVTASQGGVPVAIEQSSPTDLPTHGFRLSPCNLPAGSDLPDAKLTVGFVSQNTAANKMETLTLDRDTEKPTLKTTSTPRKGTKVKPGDTIKIRMEASEEYSDARLGWQTGVKKIQLIDEGPNPVMTPRFEATGGPRPCKEKQWKQFLEVTYTVPPNPPPVIRLRAVAEDFAGNKDDDLGEFPTGDWYGSFKWKHTCEGGGNRDETHGIADLTLDYDGRGNLTGTLAGSTPHRAQTHALGCAITQVAPSTFSAKLVGSYTPSQNTFSVQAVDSQTRPGRALYSCPAHSNVIDLFIATVYEAPMFKDAFRDLRRQPDDSRASTGEATFSAGGGTCTTKYSLTLRQVQN